MSSAQTPGLGTVLTGGWGIGLYPIQPAVFAGENPVQSFAYTLTNRDYTVTTPDYLTLVNPQSVRPGIPGRFE